MARKPWIQFNFPERRRPTPVNDIYDDDLQALVTEANLESENERIKLVSLKVASETGEIPKAQIVLAVDGKERQATKAGAGAVDAVF